MPRTIKKKSNEDQNRRARIWTIIVYPESAPKEWEDIINEDHLEWCCSPLHSDDINPDGTPKKPHWHIMLWFDGVKSYDQVKIISDKLHSPRPFIVQSARGLVRYMLHLDNPEKVQYSRDQIRSFNGLDVDRFFEASEGEKIAICKEMIEWIEENDITEYRDLVHHAMIEHYEDWFRVLMMSCTMVMKEYIRSRRHKMQENTNE